MFFQLEIIDIAVPTFKDNTSISDVLRSFYIIPASYYITSNLWTDQNNEKFYHVKQTVKTGDVTIYKFYTPICDILQKLVVHTKFDIYGVFFII